jgi:hypothetical protein
MIAVNISRYYLLVCIGVFFSASQAQVDTVHRWHIGAGAAFPAAPDQFYDYWHTGFQTSCGVELPSSMRFIQFISAEIGYFGFDQKRFLKKIGIENSKTSVGGSATYIFSLAYFVRYPFIEYRRFRPTFFAGLGCADIFRSSATIEYPNAPTTQGGTNSIVLTIPLGGSIAVYEWGNKALEVSLTYTIGLSKKQTINSNYSCVKIEYIFSR